MNQSYIAVVLGLFGRQGHAHYLNYKIEHGLMHCDQTSVAHLVVEIVEHPQPSASSTSSSALPSSESGTEESDPHLSTPFTPATATTCMHYHQMCLEISGLLQLES